MLLSFHPNVMVNFAATWSRHAWSVLMSLSLSSADAGAPLSGQC